MLDSVFDVLVIMAPVEDLDDLEREVFAAGGSSTQGSGACCEEEWLVAK